MENAIPVPESTALPPAAGRLTLTAAAALALGALSWAAWRVRSERMEAEHLRTELAAARMAERAAGAAARASAVPDRSGDLERRLREAQSEARQTAEKAAARETELNGIITFLRQENTAAQQTIARLSNPEPPPEPGPELAPSVPPKKESSSGGSRRKPR